MSPLRKDVSPTAGRVRGLLLLLVLAGGLSLSIHGLLVVLAHRVPLGVLLGPSLTPLLGSLLLATLAGAAVLVMRLLGLLRGTFVAVGWRPLRLLIYVTFLGAACFVAFLQPYRTIVLQASVAVLAGLYAVLVFFADALAARVPRRVRALLNLALINLCVLTVGTELGLRAWAARNPSPLFALRDADAVEMIETFRLKPIHARPGYPVNGAGFFDEEFRAKAPGKPLAVVIGDSFSAGTVPHRDHFTTVAERALGLGPVIANVGVPGVGPREYLHLLHSVALPLQPDVVVVDLFVGNDLDAPHGEIAAGGALRSWLDRDQLLVVSVPRVLLAASGGGGAVKGAGRPGDPVAADAETPARPARILTVDEALAVSDEDLRRLHPELEDPLGEVPGLPAPAFLKLELERAHGICGSASLPWRSVFALLSEMQRACGAIPFLVMLIPDELQVEDAVWEEVRAAAGDEWLERERPQRILDDWLTERGIPHVDLLPVLRAVEPLSDGRLHVFHVRETHFNARGNAATGAALAELLAPYLGAAPSR